MTASRSVVSSRIVIPSQNHGREIQIACYYPDLNKPDPKHLDVPFEIDSEGVEIAREARLEIEVRHPEADEALNEGRRICMKERHIKEVRQGRGDTGVQLWGEAGIANVCMEGLIESVTKCRPKCERPYRLVEAKTQIIPARNGRGDGHIRPGITTFDGTEIESRVNSVVRLWFSNAPAEEPLPEEDEREILAVFKRHMAGTPWRYCHPWENNSSWTVNLAGVDPQEGIEIINLLRYHPKPQRLRAVQDNGWDARGPFYIKPCAAGYDL